MFAARRYRLYPGDKQALAMRQHLGACRVVFNLAVEQRGLAYRFTGSSPGYSRQCRDLKALRDDPSIAPWLSETPAQLLQQALRDADWAFERFFAGRAGYPRFKTKSGENTFRDPQGVYVKRLSRRWGTVKIQGVGLIRFRWHRAPVGRIKHATVILESDGTWWVALTCEVRNRRRAPVGLPAVGVDLGVAVAAALSTGELLDVTPLRPKEAERLLRLERQREHQRIGSRNRQRTQRQIAAIKARARRRRLHFAETISHHLTKNHGMVAFEALDIRAMTRSAKGTVEQPGTCVRQKAGLNRAILDKGWGLLRARTREKAALRGGEVVLVNPCVHLPNMPLLRQRRSRQQGHAKPLDMQCMRLHRSRRRRRGSEHPPSCPHRGPRTWCRRWDAGGSPPGLRPQDPSAVRCRS